MVWRLQEKVLEVAVINLCSLAGGFKRKHNNTVQPATAKYGVTGKDESGFFF